VSSHQDLFPKLLRKPKDEASKKEKARKQFNISSNAVVFGCFSQLWKIDPKTWTVWLDILKETKDSYLFLMRWGPKWNEKNLKKLANKVIKF